MLTLKIEHPAELHALVRALTAVLPELPALPAERPARVRYAYSDDSELTAVEVELEPE